MTLCCLFTCANSLRAADFEVATPGFFFSFNGGDANPVITLVRGQIYAFHVETEPDHPLYITPSDGVQNNNIYDSDSQGGPLIFTVPTNAVNDDIQYFCPIHGFGNTFEFVDPPTTPAPPVIQILNFTVGTNIVLTSTGTNTWSVIPEFTTNIGGTNWFALTVQTNNFFNGTNETICGRPPGTNVFIRIRSTPK